ncbi:MAG: acyl-CoA dehydrogenase family protein [Solirubrobacterales bacterium]
MTTITALPTADAWMTDERRAFVEAIRDFVKRELGTREQRAAATNDYTEAHSPGIYAQLAGLGWLGASVSEDFGGSGGSIVDACLFLEETSRGMVPMSGFPVSLIVAGAYERFGTVEQKAEILGGIVQGRVEAIAMSEPEAGSDVGNLQCRAERSDGGFVLNGQKTWISAAHIADHILVVARTGRDGSKHEGVTMLSVPTGSDGLEISGIQTMGGKEVNDVYLTDCFVPEERVLGEVDGGWMQLMAGLNVERLITAATVLGLGQRAFDDALAYVKERKQFGRPIGSFQTIRHRLADLGTELECARLLVYDVARKTEAAPDQMLPREASMVKLKATEAAKKTALEGMQMMGGYGYSTEYDMERLVRMTLVSTIYAGTSEIQREIISKTYGL